jgi:crotonobetainyl-CoA:carnitine CoA-transferase CaiB-like acyl-CoA transferase
VKQHSKSAIIEILDRISVPFAPVAKPGDLLDDPHLAAGERLVDVDLGAGKHTRLPKLPIEMGEHDLGLRLQPPKAGEHSREILAELGLDKARIDALSSSGVILVPDETP